MHPPERPLLHFEGDSLRREQEANGIIVVLLKVLGGILAVPSVVILFLGGITLRFWPWFPPLRPFLEYVGVLASAAAVGSILLLSAKRLGERGRRHKQAGP